MELEVLVRHRADRRLPLVEPTELEPDVGGSVDGLKCGHVSVTRRAEFSDDLGLGQNQTNPPLHTSQVNFKLAVFANNSTVVAGVHWPNPSVGQTQMNPCYNR